MNTFALSFLLSVFLLLGAGTFVIWVLSRPQGVFDRLIENRQKRLNSLSESFISMNEKMEKLKAEMDTHEMIVTATKDMILSRMASFESRYGKAEASNKKDADIGKYFPVQHNNQEVS